MHGEYGKYEDATGGLDARNLLRNITLVESVRALRGLACDLQGGTLRGAGRMAYRADP